VRPRITGPRTCSSCGPPPRFHVDTGAFLLYAVELAGSPDLMVSRSGRGRDNYFFGGDADEAFATGPCWHVPATVWHRLRRRPLLYYRVIAVDPVAGTSHPSVADDHLQLLPSIQVWPVPDAEAQERA
jgi:hypothetical protein